MSRPRILRYCRDEDQLYRELEVARTISSAVSLLYQAMQKSRHHTALQTIGKALTEARCAHAQLEEHCQYYFGPETQGPEAGG